ncbi:ABC transporter ATP-binding protein [Pusillimonas caeni]|uniref:ABC transporter ATP-binding protein n=1 Tax=Pusillimonas caeni TaxID=1348472 RepID=UPI000E599D90|nr:ABC transporter ATP-binding protein [Pusillimonas caeni]TFL15609.1 ABC transporter ATP-binding protein [Pusillimonas caeni]
MTSSRLPGRPWPFLLKYVRARRWQFAGLALLVVGAGSCAVAVQYGMKLIVDAMAQADRQTAAVWPPLVMFLSLIALENVLWRCSGWLGCRVIVATGVDIRVDLFEHLIGHPMRYFARHMAGSLSSRITATAGSTGAILSRLVWNISPPAVDFIGAVVVLTLVDYHMALALVAFVAVVAAIIIGFGVRGRPLHRAYGREAASVGGELVDTVSNVWTIKAFSSRERERERLAGAFGVEAQAQRRSWMYLEKARVIHDICLWAMAGIMLTWAIHSWQAAAISAGDVVLVSALTFRILHGSRDLALALVETSQEYGVVAEMLEVIGERHAFSDNPGASSIRPREGRIEFRGVWFRYSEGEPLFKGLDLVIPAGQKLGLAGPSGSGKSTLLALIQRLDDVQQGEVLIDGTPVTQMRQDSLREGIAAVPQDINLFHRSVMENIRYSRPEASDEEVYVAARHARCDDFIRQLRHGYDTIIGERGITLSGGQRQRLAIARAFLKDAPVLLLDEATSALDTQSERAVQHALQDLIQGRTVIAVAHRLSTLAGFDRIVMLVDGAIVEDGSPEALLGRDSLFRSLWQAQSDLRQASAY